MMRLVRAALAVAVTAALALVPGSARAAGQSVCIFGDSIATA